MVSHISYYHLFLAVAIAAAGCNYNRPSGQLLTRPVSIVSPAVHISIEYPAASAPTLLGPTCATSSTTSLPLPPLASK